MDSVPPDVPVVIGVPAASGTWTIRDSVWIDRSNVHVTGEGASFLQKPSASGSWGRPMFGVGIPRVWRDEAGNPIVIDASYRPNIASLTPNPPSLSGTNHGFRTKGHAHAVIAGQPILFGRSQAGTAVFDLWERHRHVTLDLAVYLHDGPATMGAYCSWGPWDDPQPFSLGVDPDLPHDLIFKFKVAKWKNAMGARRTHHVHELRFAQPSNNGWHRMSIQVNLPDQLAMAFVNGARVAASLDQPIEPDLHWRAWEHSHFTIGGEGENALKPSFGSRTGQDLDADITFGGLAALGVPRYQTVDVGQPQARLDGQSLTDTFRYLGQSVSGGYGRLLLSDPPNGSVIGWHNLHSTVDPRGRIVPREAVVSPIENVSFQGLRITAAGGTATTCFLVGSVNGLTIRDCLMAGTWHTLLSLYQGHPSQITIRNAAAQGAVALLQTERVFLDCVGLRPLDHQLTTFRLRGGSTILRHVIFGSVPDDANVYALILGSPDGIGGYHLIDEFVPNHEANWAPVRAAFEIEPERNVPDGQARVVLRNTTVSGGPSFGHSVILRSNGQDNIAYFHGENVASEMRGIATVEGRQWFGKIDPAFLRWRQQEEITYEDQAACGQVQAIHYDFRSAPRYKRWDAGCVRGFVPNPPPGGVAEWRCTKTGTYGTANPPEFLPARIAERRNSVDLSAHLIDHAYVTVSIQQ